MQYFRNTNQIQTVGLNKPIGQREECYYGWITNSSNIENVGYFPTTPGPALWEWFPCDNPTEDALLLGCGGPPQCDQPSGSNVAYISESTASIGCMSSTRFTIPPTRPPGSARPNILLFSPFTCETEFTQSMTTYEYATWTALGVSGSRNTEDAWALASYIPSGSTEYEYRVLQLISTDCYPGKCLPPISGTPIYGPIAIVSGSAYYSTTYDNPQGIGDVLAPKNFISYSVYP